MKPPALSSRRPSRKVHVRTVPIGGGSPISIQSMTTTHTRDAAATVEQIRRLAAAGCELVRVAVPTAADAEAIGAIVAASPIPVIADIHFKTSLAIRSLRAGAAKVRLNPGNIDDPDGLKEVLRLAGELGRPVRFGVNSGSVRGAAAGTEGKDLARLMVDVLMDWVGQA